MPSFFPMNFSNHNFHCKLLVILLSEYTILYMLFFYINGFTVSSTQKSLLYFFNISNLQPETSLKVHLQCHFFQKPVIDPLQFWQYISFYVYREKYPNPFVSFHVPHCIPVAYTFDLFSIRKHHSSTYIVLYIGSDLVLK